MNGWLIKVNIVSFVFDTSLTVLTPLIVSEQYRVLGGMLKIVQEMDPTRGIPICNNQACPTMSAGS